MTDSHDAAAAAGLRHLGKHRVVICQETLQRFTGTKTERKEEFTKTLTKAPVIPTLCNFNDFKIIIIQLILAYIYSHFEVHRNHCISLFCFLYMWHYGELRITLKLLNIYNVYINQYVLPLMFFFVRVFHTAWVWSYLKTFVWWVWCHLLETCPSCQWRAIF